MKNFREEVIEAAKAMKVTSRELGYEPEIVYRDDNKFIDAVKEMILCLELDHETVREYIPEKYWEDLGIKPEKRYKIVSVKMEKTVYRTVNVVMPEDANENNFIDDYIDIENNYLDTVDEDEDYWEVNNTEVINYNVKEDDDRLYDCANSIHDFE